MPELDKLIDLPPTKEEVYVFTRTPAFVCLSVCLLARLLKMRAWIWMKCCVSTDVKTWTNWLTFEPDPDYSPDPGTGFTSDFWILAGYLNKLWTDFDEILWIDIHGGLGEMIRFWAGSIKDPDPGSGHVFKIARRIVLKVMDGFQWNFVNE